MTSQGMTDDEIAFRAAFKDSVTFNYMAREAHGSSLCKKCSTPSRRGCRRLRIGSWGEGKSSLLTSAIPSNVLIGATGCRVGGSAIPRGS